MTGRTTKKNRAILTVPSTRTREAAGSMSGPRPGGARGAGRDGAWDRRAEIPQRAEGQPRERGDLRADLVEGGPGRGVLARQAEAAPQLAQDAPGGVGLSPRPDRGAQPLRAPLEVDHRPFELAIPARRNRHMGAIHRRALP